MKSISRLGSSNKLYRTSMIRTGICLSFLYINKTRILKSSQVIKWCYYQGESKYVNNIPTRKNRAKYFSFKLSLIFLSSPVREYCQVWSLSLQTFLSYTITWARLKYFLWEGNLKGRNQLQSDLEAGRLVGSHAFKLSKYIWKILTLSWSMARLNLLW